MTTGRKPRKPQSFREIFEAFIDMGKLSDEELTKGKAIRSNSSKNNFYEVQGGIFFQVISRIKINDLIRTNSKGLDTLTVYSKSEYRKMKCYLGKNNSSGYCIKDGELMSVFSSQQSSGNAIVQDAIKNGAKRLDCFAERHNNKLSGPLYSLYLRNGFKLDNSLNSGKPGEPYSIQKGVSSFVNADDEVEPNNPNVVVFLKL